MVAWIPDPTWYRDNWPPMPAVANTMPTRAAIPERCGQCGSAVRAHRKLVGRLTGGRRDAKYAPCPNRWHEIRKDTAP